jgi:hypothetical protein
MAVKKRIVTANSKNSHRRNASRRSEMSAESRAEDGYPINTRYLPSSYSLAQGAKDP